MTPIHSFAVAAASWQNFYVLCGTAAATLIGLMFVAVTFGASQVTYAESIPSARAFIDPPFYHFVHVLLGSCLLLIPSMTATTLGALVIAISVVRTATAFTTWHRLREAHAKYQDLELSDWLSGVVFPLLAHLLLAATGAGFLAGYAAAFSALGLITVVVLLLGIFGAWELLMWLAFTSPRRVNPPGRSDP
jgi:hypothetical protein